ncbi:hypothetical protein L596_006841 [Steinernema carpocapsae]|uniref:Uncharacterized protein n=1 Tax=Steinernema carpocapsae TaxID=34508 RepID=A0A4U5P741_STECR|nr:hypothetical protein L596_006841 [Steinernema carpocapsae]
MSLFLFSCLLFSFSTLSKGDSGTDFVYPKQTRPKKLDFCVRCSRVVIRSGAPSRVFSDQTFDASDSPFSPRPNYKSGRSPLLGGQNVFDLQRGRSPEAPSGGKHLSKLGCSQEKLEQPLFSPQPLCFAR